MLSANGSLCIRWISVSYLMGWLHFQDFLEERWRQWPSLSHLDLRGNVSSFSSFNMMLAMGFSYIALVVLRIDPFVPDLLKGFLLVFFFFFLFCHKTMLSFIRCFLCNYWANYVPFLPQFVTVMIDLCAFNHPCMPGINLSWPRRMIFLMCCWILVVSMLLGIFLHLCSSGFWSIVLFLSCTFFWFEIKVIPHRRSLGGGFIPFQLLCIVWKLEFFFF